VYYYVGLDEDMIGHCLGRHERRLTVYMLYARCKGIRKLAVIKRMSYLRSLPVHSLIHVLYCTAIRDVPRDTHREVQDVPCVL
jgi:hypothetical protein